MNTLSRRLDTVVERIEGATALDKPAELLSGLVRRAIPDGAVRDLASGTPVGHPAHPILVAVPIGSWVSAGLLDLARWPGSRRAARALVGIGLAGAVPAAVTGANDWRDTAGAERRVGIVHAALNWTAIGLYGGSWLLRRRDRHGAGAGLSLAGSAVLVASGWLGGHLSYAFGVGVDTTAFQSYPTEWTDVAASEDVEPGVPLRVDADGVPLLLLRTSAGIVAMADRCTHRGGPLHEGRLVEDCIECPWHASRFELADGSVRQGPATRPQPVLAVRLAGDRVLVRRTSDQSAQRTHSVGR